MKAITLTLTEKEALDLKVLLQQDREQFESLGDKDSKKEIRNIDKILKKIS